MTLQDLYDGVLNKLKHTKTEIEGINCHFILYTVNNLNLFLFFYNIKDEINSLTDKIDNKFIFLKEVDIYIESLKEKLEVIRKAMFQQLEDEKAKMKE